MQLPPFRLLLVASVVSICGNFSFGFNVIVNPTVTIFKQFFNECYVREYDEEISDEGFSLLWGISTAIVNVGAFVGLILVSLLNDRLGRKWALLLNNLPNVVACLVMFAAHKLLSYQLFFFGRSLFGIAMGFNTAAIGIFLTEISPTDHRGFVASLQEVSLCVANIIGTAFGLPALLGNYAQLDTILLLPILPSLILLALLLLVPDSPKHLLLTTRNELAAEASILFYHDSHAKLEQVKEEFLMESQTGRSSLLAILADAPTRRGVLIGVAVNAANISTGIAAIFFFSTSMFLKAGLSLSAARFSTLGMTTLNLLASLSVVFLVDRVGRRPLVLSSLLLCTLCNIVYVVFAMLQQSLADSTWPALVVVVATLLHTIIYGLGSGPVSWFITNELVPQSARSTAQPIAISANWIGQLVDLFAFFPLFSVIGPISFLILHVAPCLLLTFVLFKFMPETRGRNIAEIMENRTVIEHHDSDRW